MKKIPHRLYLTEEQMPKQWYNLRADMKELPDPMINPGTGKPATEEDLYPVFCEKLASAINTVLEKQTIQISKGLFRYAVELEIIMRMMAESGKFDPETLTAFRREAVNNVRRTRGKVRLDSYFNRKDTDSL